MDFSVAKSARPTYLQHFGVVGVVSMWLTRLSTEITFGRANQYSNPDGGVYSRMCNYFPGMLHLVSPDSGNNFTRVFLSPLSACFRNFIAPFLALLASPFTVVSVVVVAVFSLPFKVLLNGLLGIGVIPTPTTLLEFFFVALVLLAVVLLLNLRVFVWHKEKSIPCPRIF